MQDVQWESRGHLFGKGTDILIITHDNNYPVSESDIGKLNVIYEKELDFGRYSEDLNNLDILKSQDVMLTAPFT